MKYAFALSVALLLSHAVAGESDVIRLSEPVETTETAEVFGAPLNQEARAVTLDALLSMPSAHLGEAVRVDTRVTEVCQKKGCFYIATDGMRHIRVSFKDYGFFVPTNVAGKTLTLTGTLIKRELSEEDAAHLRDDAKTDEIQAGVVYELIADAVAVPIEG